MILSVSETQQSRSISLKHNNNNIIGESQSQFRDTVCRVVVTAIPSLVRLHMNSGSGFGLNVAPYSGNCEKQEDERGICSRAE
jgi:hypothetical protein